MEDDPLIEESEPPGTAPGFAYLEQALLGTAATHPPPYQHPAVFIKPADRQGIFKENPKTRAFRRRFFPQVRYHEWNDWRWQLRHRITHVEELSTFLQLSLMERLALEQGQQLPMAITPYYASLLSPTDDAQPLRRTVIPTLKEFAITGGEQKDPLAEDRDSPVPGIVHRYPDRVLFLVTDFCSTYCRYCTRSRLVGHSHLHGEPSTWEEGLAYIESHREIRDVLISGGDPLTLPDEMLSWLLSRLKQIDHVEILRIGTKVPVVMPQRITPPLLRCLRRYHPLWMSIHVSHPDELTPDMHHACTRLADAGIPLGSQTVLLAGINDDTNTMRTLMQGLLKCRIRPYYLYQCDPIHGSSHFRTPVSKGLDIIKGLRGHTTGYAVPSYVIDAPGGGGKIPLLPPYLCGKEGQDLVLENYAGNLYRYPDCSDTRSVHQSAESID